MNSADRRDSQEILCWIWSERIVALIWSFLWRPRKDSNLRTRFRKPMLYPLSYGGPSLSYQSFLIVTPARETPLQLELSEMSWLAGERNRIYQPIDAPELAEKWITVRKC